MDRKVTKEFNSIGEKITIEIQLKYEDMMVTELPDHCGQCPVGFMKYDCGRKVPLNWEKRDDGCKLKVIKI